MMSEGIQVQIVGDHWLGDFARSFPRESQRNGMADIDSFIYRYFDQLRYLYR
jgi:hypothetical protein